MNIYLFSSAVGAAGLLQSAIEPEITNRRVCFVTAASEGLTYKVFVDDARNLLKDFGADVMECPITGMTRDSIVEVLDNADWIYVAGGNTYRLLKSLRLTGADQLITDAVRAGIPYLGESAGSIVLAPDIGYISKMDPPPYEEDLNTRGLNLIDVYPLPHFESPPFRQEASDIAAAYGKRLPLLKMTNADCIVVNNGSVRRLVEQEEKSVS